MKIREGKKGPSDQQMVLTDQQMPISKSSAWKSKGQLDRREKSERSKEGEVERGGDQGKKRSRESGGEREREREREREGEGERLPLMDIGREI